MVSAHACTQTCTLAGWACAQARTHARTLGGLRARSMHAHGTTTQALRLALTRAISCAGRLIASPQRIRLNPKPHSLAAHPTALRGPSHRQRHLPLHRSCVRAQARRSAARVVELERENERVRRSGRRKQTNEETNKQTPANGRRVATDASGSARPGAAAALGCGDPAVPPPRQRLQRAAAVDRLHPMPRAAPQRAASQDLTYLLMSNYIVYTIFL